MAETVLIDRLKDFTENEGSFCSMDIAGITPEYVYGMWEDGVAFEEIESGLRDLRAGNAISPKND